MKSLRSARRIMGEHATSFAGSSQSGESSGSESAGLKEGSGDVVGEVAESEGEAAEVFESSVDGLGPAVGHAGALEVGQYIGGTLLQRPAQRVDLAQRDRYTVTD